MGKPLTRDHEEGPRNAPGRPTSIDRGVNSRNRARTQPPSAAPPPSPGDAARHSRNLDPAAVERVRTRLDKLNELIRVAIADPTAHNIAAVVDTARWARLDVDSALALKGHVADLRDAHWTTLQYSGREGALATFATFIEAPVGSLNLVAMRNLRARLEGLITIARGLAHDVG